MFLLFWEVNEFVFVGWIVLVYFVLMYVDCFNCILKLVLMWELLFIVVKVLFWFIIKEFFFNLIMLLFNFIFIGFKELWMFLFFFLFWLVGII